MDGEEGAAAKAVDEADGRQKRASREKQIEEDETDRGFLASYV